MTSKALKPTDQKRVDAAVKFINERAIKAGLDLACEVGKYILDEFFDGSYENFTDTRRNKPTSFTALVEREDLVVPRTTLYNFVRVSHQIKDLPARVAEQLSVSHHRALLPLPDKKTKVRLAKKAAKEGWTKAELEQAAREYVPRSPQGRKRLPSWAKAPPKISKYLNTALEEEISCDQVERLGDERVQDLLDALDESRMRIDWLQANLEEALEEIQE